jgi:hypothetical protein
MPRQTAYVRLDVPGAAVLGSQVVAARLADAGHESCSTKIFKAAVPRAAMSTARSISRMVSRQGICVSNGIVRCGQVRQAKPTIASAAAWTQDGGITHAAMATPASTPSANTANPIVSFAVRLSVAGRWSSSVARGRSTMARAS